MNIGYELELGLRGFCVSVLNFGPLNEAIQTKVSDEALGKLFSFISNKYNEIDFSEIEKSHGDMTKFKYSPVISETITQLRDIYGNTSKGIKGINEVQIMLGDIATVFQFLMRRAEDISYLYGKEVPYIILMYNSAVAGIIMSLSELVSLTIRFITSKGSDDLDVEVEAITNANKYTHLRNIQLLAKMVYNKDLDKLIDTSVGGIKNSFRGSVNESFMLGALTVDVTLKLLAIPVIIIILTKLIPITREIIYSIYYARVKIEEALDIQIGLLNTNIESLEDRSIGKTGKELKRIKRVIGKQVAVAKALEVTKNKFALKIESAEPFVKRDIAAENKSLSVTGTTVTADEILL